MNRFCSASIILVIIFLVGGCSSNKPPERVFDLKKCTWNLHDEADSLFLEGVDPSDVHLALLSKKIIPDPFYGTNEKRLQWIGKKNWIFSASFDLPAEMAGGKRLVLAADGLDTYATVDINGKKVLQTDNMFRQWKADVTNILRKKGNKIIIRFVSPERMNAAKAEQSPVPLPEIRGFTRKAAYQFGWDWGPRFVTMGVWKGLKIIAESDPVIENLYVQQPFVSTQRARLEISTAVKSDKNGKYTLKSYVNNILKHKKEILLEAGNNRITDTLVINNPRLWWPDGMGKQPLYRIKQELLSNDEVVSEKEVQTGIRKLELVTRKDTAGNSFFFRINGKPLFAKGANYIPQDNFLSRVKDERYRKLLVDAQKSHINMLRVWGGGTYEKDIFYRLCDSLGILVWQDFMFAGNMVPPDDAFTRNVAAEVEQQIIRLRNHPCLALWCGNNEVEEAWSNWGWQKQLHMSEPDSTLLWKAYMRIFDTVIPEKIKQYSGEIPYWRSSPSIGWGHKEAYRQGDVHYWGVWWGKEPFEEYKRHTGRFMSEYGFQGMPPVRTLKRVCPDSSLYLYSPCMKSHQKHPFGWENIALYMKRDYRVPSTFEGYDYVSQMLQADGISTAIEAHRRAMPYCMGTLYWQLNDCWPVVSWSSIDYYGQWKALQYKVKRLYEPVILSFEKRGQNRVLYVVSDTAEPFTGMVTIQLIDFDGTIYFADNVVRKIAPMRAEKVMEYTLPANRDTTRLFLAAKLEYNGKTRSRTLSFFSKPKYLKLPLARITHTLKREKNAIQVTLQTDKFVKGLYLQSNIPGHWDDNFFDLLPGERRSVFFFPDTVSREEMKVKIMSLATVQ